MEHCAKFAVSSSTMTKGDILAGVRPVRRRNRPRRKKRIIKRRRPSHDLPLPPICEMVPRSSHETRPQQGSTGRGKMYFAHGQRGPLQVPEGGRGAMFHSSEDLREDK